jgi:hypothetical protein
VDIPTLNERVAWAAGFFEGEGYFSLGRDRRKPHRSPRAVTGITNTDLEMLKRFHEVVRVGHVSGPQIRPNRKPMWQWQATGSIDVRFIAELFGPWLSERRSARAREVIEISGRPNLPAPPRANLGKSLSAEHRLKLSLIHTGMQFSEETRARMSEAQRKRRIREATHG